MEQTANVNAGQPPEELISPPKPPLAFRVGVVGHRPDRLGEADLSQLGRVIGGILVQTQKAVKAFAQENVGLFADGPPVLRAISPLAEGTDRIFAEQALALGWELCCVMPFAQDVYENDFQPAVALEDDSLQRFGELRARARVCFQLDGSRADEGAAYGAGGRVVLNQSDLLIVVWDGQRQNKRGGTVALRRVAEHSRSWIYGKRGPCEHPCEECQSTATWFPVPDVQKQREHNSTGRQGGHTGKGEQELHRESHPSRGLAGHKPGCDPWLKGPS